MISAVRDLLRGIRLLRHPELAEDLGVRWRHLQLVNTIRKLNDEVRVSREIVVTNYRPGGLTLGRGVTIEHGSILTFGDEHNGLGKISLGNGTWMGPYNNVRSGGGEISIGENCLISQFCTLVATNHGTDRDQLIMCQCPSASPRNITLESDVWLGAGVTITPGVTLGKGVVVGANSVVTKSIPDYEIWAGTPARKIGVR